MKLSRLLLACCSCGVFGFSTSASAVIIASSTFDSELDGWTSNTPAEVSWSASGGNPNGYALFQDASTNSTSIFAPAAFLGDLSALNGEGRISWDHRIFQFGTSTAVLPYTIEIVGGGGTAIWEGSTPSSATDWLTQTASLIETDWTISGATWGDILSDVTELRIQFELVGGGSGTDIAGIDNVILETVPIPPALWLFSFGLISLIGISRRKKTS